MVPQTRHQPAAADLAALPPSDAHGFTPREVSGIMGGIYARGDRLMLWFLASHMVLALGLAFYHDTWIATLSVGVTAVGAFALSAHFLPRTFFTRVLAGISQQAFVALHIFQLYGQSEQHFWYFIAFTMMIVYQDWICMWPAALLIIAQHTLFAGLHNAGLPVHFFPEPYVGFTKLFYHFGIALVHVAICGYWAHLLRQQTLSDAWRRLQLFNDQVRLEEQLVALRASKAALQASTEALREASRRQRAILDNSSDLMWVKDQAGRYAAVNSAFERLVGRPAAEIVGRSSDELVPSASAAEIELHERDVIAARTPITRERRYQFDGDERIFDITITPILDDRGAVAGLTGTAHDITERRRLELDRERAQARLQEAQKLESLGLLAGGVAHDFNNILGVIQANAELARADIPADSSARESFLEIERSTQRAADLTRQMLAYAGMGRVAIQRLDPSALVRDTADLLRSVISKKVELKLLLGDGLPAVEADTTQLRQVVMNLISNASDAIGDAEGRITLRTGTTRLRRGAIRWPQGQAEPEPGEYVVLEVTDTGSGMSAETQARIFDPFFTTKFVGRGLGLAAVLGILRSHRGAIDIASEVGRGSTFRVYLPAAAGGITEPLEPLSSPVEHLPRTGIGITVLIVDDEPTLRAISARILERVGYDVLVAEDGVAAMALLDGGASVDVVVLDMLMPRMNGEETLRAIRERFPTLPVLLTSGFSEAVAAERLLAGPHVAFVQKPYTVRQLIAEVGSLLAAARNVGVRRVSSATTRGE